MSLKKPSDLFEKKTYLNEEYSVLDRPGTDEIPLRYSSENFVRYKSQVNNNKKSLNQIEEMTIMVNLLKEEIEKVENPWQTARQYAGNDVTAVYTFDYTSAGAFEDCRQKILSLLEVNNA